MEKRPYDLTHQLMSMPMNKTFFSENALSMGSSAFSFSVPCQLEAIHLQEMCVGHRLGRHSEYNTRRISEIISPQQVEVLKNSTY